MLPCRLAAAVVALHAMAASGAMKFINPLPSDSELSNDKPTYEVGSRLLIAWSGTPENAVVGLTMWPANQTGVKQFEYIQQTMVNLSVIDWVVTPFAYDLSVTNEFHMGLYINGATSPDANSQNFFIKAKADSSTSSSSSVSSATTSFTASAATTTSMPSNTTPTPTSSAAASGDVNQSDSSSLSTGAKAGIGVGIAIAAVLGFAAAWVLLRRRQGKPGDNGGNHQPIPPASLYDPQQSPGYSPYSAAAYAGYNGQQGPQGTATGGGVVDHYQQKYEMTYSEMDSRPPAVNAEGARQEMYVPPHEAGYTPATTMPGASQTGGGVTAI